MIETTKPRIFGPIFAYFDGTKKLITQAKNPNGRHILLTAHQLI